MATAVAEKRSGPSPAFLKNKAEFAEFKKKAGKKLREMRAERPMNALVNVTGTFVGAVPTGIVCGAVPEVWEVGEKKTKVPTGVITEVASILGGAFVLTVSFLMKMEYGIHVGGGMASTGSAFLARRGTYWLMTKGKEWWAENKEKEGLSEAA